MAAFYVHRSTIIFHSLIRSLTLFLLDPQTIHFPTYRSKIWWYCDFSYSSVEKKCPLPILVLRCISVFVYLLFQSIYIYIYLCILFRNSIVCKNDENWSCKKYCRGNCLMPKVTKYTNTLQIKTTMNEIRECAPSALSNRFRLKCDGIFSASFWKTVFFVCFRLLIIDQNLIKTWNLQSLHVSIRLMGKTGEGEGERGRSQFLALHDCSNPIKCLCTFMISFVWIF